MQNRNRGLGWLKPTPRLIVFVILSTLFTLAHSWPAVLAALAAGLILLVAGGRYPRAALIGATSALVLTFLGNALFAKSGDLLFEWWVFHVSTESLLTGLRFGLRIFAMILPAIALIAVTPLYEYLDAFRGLRIPPAAEMYLTIMLRYVDILWYEIQISMKAMAMRGVNWEGSVQERIAAFRRLMMPLIFRILDHIEGQTLAIDNRGGITARGELPSIAPDAPAVAMDDVWVRYDAGSAPTDAHALSGASLTIEAGQTAVLLGPTGAGKTSALLLCTGLIPLSVGRMKGNVRLFGHNTRQASLGELGRLARIVFPSAVQGLVGLTVRDELAISLRVSDLDEAAREAAMVDALTLVGLDESFLPRLTLGLSGGEMQRVALASAIVARPHLLALDDVTVQLDPGGKREVVAALQTLLEQQITTVMTDPYVALLDEVGSQYVVLEKGHVVEQTGELTGQTIRRGGLRVPQTVRLGQALGLDLPPRPAEALPVLCANRTPGCPPATPMATEAPAEVLRAENLTYRYGDEGSPAVDGVSLSLYAGQCVAILGHNGSGKTTTALLLAQAMQPDTGTITIDGEPVSREAHRGAVAYVFQEPTNQMVTMQVAEELAFGPQQLGWPEDEVQAAVQREAERFGLPLDESPLRLTPAEARKLAIAANLTMHPRVLILDEPTNNLDEAETEQLVARLRELQAGGTSIVLITHDVEVACRQADRLIVMSDGRVLLDGPAAEVMRRPDVLAQTDVVPPAVVELSLQLWPDEPPALSVEALAACFAPPLA